MARRKTLEDILSQLNNETGQIDTPSYGVGARNSLVNLINRVQETLWDDHDWPFLEIKKTIQLQAGQRYYDIPSEMATDRIKNVQVKYAGTWHPVKFGIEQSELFAIHDSDIDQRFDPAARWDHYYDTGTDTEQLEVWPIPASNYDSSTYNGSLLITGTKKLGTLEADSDRADLDDRLIVLFAAAEVLARDRTDDAQVKLQKAQERYAALKSNTGQKKQFSLGDMDEECSRDPLRIRAVYGDYSGA